MSQSDKPTTTTLRSATFWMIVTVLFGILITVYVFYPGFMSPDSVSQLQQARRGVFGDWHPPLMSWLWGLFDRLVPGPIGMLVFHSAMFWSALGIWMMLIVPKRRTMVKCLAVLVIGLFPSIFALLGAVWKDTGMGAACLLGSALLLLAERKRSLVALAFGLLALWYALTVRHNAIVAVLPLVVYAVKILYEQRFLSSNIWRRRDLAAVSVLGLGVLALMMVADSAVTYQLTEGKSSHPVQQILVHDLAAISIDTGTVLVPVGFSRAGSLTVSDLEKIYTPKTVVSLFCCDDAVTRLELTSDPDLLSELQGAWARAVLSHPLPYLWHRIRVLDQAVGFTVDEVCYPYQYGIVENDLGIAYRETATQHLIFARLWTVRNTFFFRAWIYLVALAVAVAIIFWRRMKALRTSQLLLAIGVSGLLYDLAYFFVGTSCDFRMHYWTVITAPLLLASLALVLTEPRFAGLLGREESD